MNKTKEKIMTSRRFLVLGAGKSGLAVAKLLKQQNKIVIVNDQKEIKELPDTVRQLEQLEIPFIFGEHPLSLLSSTDVVIVSPGISPNINIIKTAMVKGYPIIGELEYASYFINKPIITITGTNGKTTVTTWIYYTLRELGINTALGGNNDTPLSDIVLLAKSYDWIVAEVSSYQLEYCYDFHPQIAGVLNVTPDHISRHSTLKEYADVKSKIFKNQQREDIAIINEDDDWVRQMKIPTDVSQYRFSLEMKVPTGAWIENENIHFNETYLGHIQQIPLKGKHNLANALAVLCALCPIIESPEKVFKAMCSFKGVPHRIEFIAQKDGVEFYNDSKSTNVESLKVALESFNQPIILIAGGQGKGASYQPLRPLIQEKVCFLITLGEDAHNIEEAFSDLVKTTRVNSMEEAVQTAWENAFPNAVVLLSPACASFDMYPNYEFRGEHFRKCVQQLLRKE